MTDPAKPEPKTPEPAQLPSTPTKEQCVEALIRYVAARQP